MLSTVSYTAVIRNERYFNCFVLIHRKILLDSVSNKHEVHDAIELLDVDSVQLLSGSGDSPAASPSTSSRVVTCTLHNIVATTKIIHVKIISVQNCVNWILVCCIRSFSFSITNCGCNVTTQGQRRCSTNSAIRGVTRFVDATRRASLGASAENGR